MKVRGLLASKAGAGVTGEYLQSVPILITRLHSLKKLRPHRALGSRIKLRTGAAHDVSRRIRCTQGSRSQVHDPIADPKQQRVAVPLFVGHMKMRLCQLQNRLDAMQLA